MRPNMNATEAVALMLREGLGIVRLSDRLANEVAEELVIKLEVLGFNIVGPREDDNRTQKSISP